MHYLLHWPWHTHCSTAGWRCCRCGSGLQPRAAGSQKRKYSFNAWPGIYTADCSGAAAALQGSIIDGDPRLHLSCSGNFWQQRHHCGIRLSNPWHSCTNLPFYTLVLNTNSTSFYHLIFNSLRSEKRYFERWSWQLTLLWCFVSWTILRAHWTSWPEIIGMDIESRTC